MGRKILNKDDMIFLRSHHRFQQGKDKISWPVFTVVSYVGINQRKKLRESQRRLLFSWTVTILQPVCSCVCEFSDTWSSVFSFSKQNSDLTLRANVLLDISQSWTFHCYIMLYHISNLKSHRVLLSPCCIVCCKGKRKQQISMLFLMPAENNLCPG